MMPVGIDRSYGFRPFQRARELFFGGRDMTHLDCPLNDVEFAVNFIEEVKAKTSVCDVLTSFLNTIRLCGRTSYMVVDLPDPTENLDRTVLAFGAPEAWFQHYLDTDSIRHDPVITAKPMKKKIAACLANAIVGVLPPFANRGSDILCNSNGRGASPLHYSCRITFLLRAYAMRVGLVPWKKQGLNSRRS